MKTSSPTAAGFLAWLLCLLCLTAPLGAQTILYPVQDQENVPITGKDLFGPDIDGVLFEMTVREGSPNGTIVFHRTDADSPILSMDGMKRNTTYYGFIRIIGRSKVAMVRFYTGPRPAFGAYHPPHYNMIPGEPVEVTATTWGAIDSVAWVDSLGSTLSNNHTLILPSDPGVAGIYTFVASGPGGIVSIPVWVRWMAAPVIRELPEFLTIPLGESRTLNAVVDALDVSLEWRLFPADGSSEWASVASTSPTFRVGDGVTIGNWIAELRASNDAGNTVATVPVEFGTAPVDANQLKLVQVEMGSDFELTSEWLSTPPTHTQWTLPDGTELPWDEGTSLSLENARAVHAGIWTVRAINVFGTSTGHIQVRVIPRPDICLDLPLKRTVAQGTDFGLFMLPCVVGDPDMRFHWYHNGIEIPGENGTMLIRTNFTAAVAGVYSFKISTPLNEAHSTPCVVTLQPTVPTAPLRLKIESVESGIRLSWPSEYELRDAPGYHALQGSTNLFEWLFYSATDIKPALVDGRWVVDLPTFEADSELGLNGGFFRIVPWAEDL